MNDQMRQVIAEVVKSIPMKEKKPRRTPRPKSPPKPPNPKPDPNVEQKPRNRVYPVPAHGTAARYANRKYRCRCIPCKEAYGEASLRQRNARYERYRLNNYEGITHGTTYGYNQAGCRCQPCLEAVLLQHRLDRKKPTRKPETRAQKDRRNELQRLRRQKRKEAQRNEANQRTTTSND